MPRSLPIDRPLRTARFTVLAVLAALAARPAAAATPAPLLGHPIQYVIVTSQALAPSFVPLVDWKIRKGVPAAIETIENIRDDYPVAADDAERVRKFLQDARAAGAQWALIGGDTDVIPIRYARTMFYGGQDLPTDLYYACLDGSWNADGDGHYGEGFFDSANPGDNADLSADLYVGRAPVRTPAEAARVVARTLQYERTPAGDYEDGRLFAAEVLFPTNWIPGDPISFDGASLVEPLLPMFTAHGLPVTRLYQNFADPGYVPGALPESRAAVLAALNSGFGLVGLIGAGDATRIATGDDFIDIADALGLTNAARPFAAWTLGCDAARPDVESIGEAMLRSPTGGAAAFIGGSHFSFPTAERAYFETFMSAVHDTGVVRIGEGLAHARAPFIPFSGFDSVNRWTQMILELFGDPELGIWTDRPAALTVFHPPSVSPGQPVPVVVTFGGQPVAGARVTIYQPGQVLLVLVTDALGQASGIPDGAEDGVLAVTVTGRDLHPYEGTLLFGTITAATATLMQSVLTPGRVTLTWDAPGWRAGEATLERREGGAWSAAGRVEPGEGILVTVDESVRAGTRYEYRLARSTGGETEYSREATIDVPAAFRFALEAIAPNPVEAGSRISLSLESGRDASLEVFDLAGRLRWTRSLAGFTAGEHSLGLESVGRLPAGVYLIRLREAGRSLTRRVVVL